MSPPRTPTGYVTQADHNALRDKMDAVDKRLVALERDVIVPIKLVYGLALIILGAVATALVSLAVNHPH